MNVDFEVFETLVDQYSGRNAEVVKFRQFICSMLATLTFSSYKVYIHSVPQCIKFNTSIK